jgi:NADPH:quinone reductase-like Zn-dependent oxidoreductase
MQRAEYTTRGPVPQDTISCVDFTLPALTAGQALIKVLAAPINPSDVLQLTGAYGILPPLPAIGGNEGVGRIVELAPDVTVLKAGQTVLLPAGSGTWTSHLVADAKRLVPLPDGADAKQLAMLTVNPPTASLLLSEFVTLEPGSWVIQNTANSAVGGYLVQLAKIRGFRTVNVVRRESAVAAVREMGGDVVVVDGPGLAKRVSAATDGVQIKLAIDAAAGSATGRLCECLAEGGVLVNYGAMSGEPCSVSPASFVFRNVTLRGFWLTQWFKKATPERQKAVFGELGMLVATGKLKARIQATYSLEQIKEAVAAAAAGEREGKILVVPN